MTLLVRHHKPVLREMRRKRADDTETKPDEDTPDDFFEGVEEQVLSPGLGGDLLQQEGQVVVQAADRHAAQSAGRCRLHLESQTWT